MLENFKKFLLEVRGRKNHISVTTGINRSSLSRWTKDDSDPSSRMISKRNQEKILKYMIKYSDPLAFNVIKKEFEEKKIHSNR